MANKSPVLNALLRGAQKRKAKFDELKQLLKDREALVNAGARQIPLPPKGRLTYPKITAPAVAYWIGEAEKKIEEIENVIAGAKAAETDTSAN